MVWDILYNEVIALEVHFWFFIYFFPILSYIYNLLDYYLIIFNMDIYYFYSFQVFIESCIIFSASSIISLFTEEKDERATDDGILLI